MLQSKVLLVFFIVTLIFLVDLWFFLLVRRRSAKLHPLPRILILILTVATALFSIGTVVAYYQADSLKIHKGMSHWIITAILVIYWTKALPVIFTMLQDFSVGVRKVFASVIKGKRKRSPGRLIKRSEFLEKAALATAAVPFSVSVFGIVHGAYDYRIKRRTIHLGELPKAFDGIRIGQISDIHCNPAYNRTAVRGGVGLLMDEKPDVIFFTGDLVNYRTTEVNEYVSILKTIQAPMGVYSVTGNHDYGNYISWPSEEAKRKNFQDFIEAHRALGYDLLMNEHRFLETGGESIAIIGVENWGKGRFPKFGRLDLAYSGTEDAPVKLLLSHDPSHWDAKVRPLYPDIDVMFAGHTHGFQMGIEVGDFRWSPAQYSYKQWADLYREGSQYLYVNRGFGCLGYLGRIGMPPELTVFELKRG
jgi:uncharacterized protein